jgi:hypothetical protein
MEVSDIGSGLAGMGIVGVLSIGGIDFLLDLCGPFLSLLGGHDHGLAPLGAACHLCGAYICVENRKLGFLFHFIISGLLFLF